MENQLYKYKIFITSIPAGTTSAEIKEFFSSIGEVEVSSKVFKIGKNRKGSCILDCKKISTKKKILKSIHLFKNRYLECRDYLRGKKLKQYIEKMKKCTIQVKSIPDPEQKIDIVDVLVKQFGEISRIKIGFNVSTKDHYAVITFEKKSSAQMALEVGVLRTKDFSYEFLPYVEAKNVIEKSKSDNAPKKTSEREFQYIKKDKNGTKTTLKKTLDLKESTNSKGAKRQFKKTDEEFHNSDVEYVKKDRKTQKKAANIKQNESQKNREQPKEAEEIIIKDSFNFKNSISEILKLSKTMIHSNHHNFRSLRLNKPRLQIMRDNAEYLQ